MTPNTPQPRAPAGYIPSTMRYSPNVNRAAMRGQAAIEHMADDMRLFAASRGHATEDDMQLLGWSRTQITLHGEAARALAYKKAADR